MTKVEDIPFRKIPHQSSLFLNYLDFSPDALRFYRNAPTMENLEHAAKDILANLAVSPARKSPPSCAVRTRVSEAIPKRCAILTAWKNRIASPS